jgi:hypothetical protein
MASFSIPSVKDHQSFDSFGWHTNRACIPAMHDDSFIQAIQKEFIKLLATIMGHNNPQDHNFLATTIPVMS